MSGPLGIAAVLVVTLTACAGRGSAAGPARPPSPPPPIVAPAPDTGAAREPPSDTSTPPEPTYGELMRGDGMLSGGPLAHAELRRWLRPLWSADTSACPPPQDVAGFHACWCRLACGVRFEARPSTLRLSWPYAEVDGPGLEIAPDGHVVDCWHSGRGVPATRVACPVAMNNVP